MSAQNDIVGTIPEDDGSAEWAAEQAAAFAGLAWWRRTHNESGNGGELMLSIATFARSLITRKQWQELGQ